MPNQPYDPIRENLLYPLDNPDYAIRNAMSDVGINPYSANPFARAVGRLGRSSANSYLVQQAADNTRQDTSPYATANQGAGGRGSAVAFSDYLRNTLSRGSGQTYASPNYPGRSEYGMDGSLGYQANMGNAGGFLQPGQNSVISKIRQYQSDLANGTANFSNTNPFLTALQDKLMSNNGMGTVSFLSDLYAPYMAPSMATAFTRALTGSGEQAIRSLANEPLNTRNDIWSYLLGY